MVCEITATSSAVSDHLHDYIFIAYLFHVDAYAGTVESIRAYILFN